MAVNDNLKLIATIIYIILSSPLILAKYNFDLLLCLIPGLRADKRWSLNQAIRVRTVRLALRYFTLLGRGDRLPLRPGKEGSRFSITRPSLYRFYQGPLESPDIKPQHVGMTWTPAQPPPPQAIGHDFTVALHFHGGAFVIGDGRDGDAGFIAKTLVRHTGCTHVCSPQYRLSSHEGNHFPAALQDALSAYLHLLQDRRVPASQIILSGDSAGANMALGLLRYIHEYGQSLGLPAPSAILLWSPWVDASAPLFQDVSQSPNYRADYITPGFGYWGAKTITNDGAIDATGPYLSPLHYPFKLDEDIPMFIHAGEREVLHDDIEEFSRRFQAAGWQHLQHYVSPGCPHDILLLGPRMGFHKEGEEAARRAKKFLLESSDVYLR